MNHAKEEMATNEQVVPDGTRNEKLWDKIVIGLAVLLLVALGAASLYGMRYSDVDTSVAVGKLRVMKSDSRIFAMDVKKDMTARVYYRGYMMSCTLKLAGAETDTVLFQGTDIEFDDYEDDSEAVLFIRMPRSGLQGDFVGAWQIYFSLPSEEQNRSDWFFIDENGSALVGQRKNTNAITTQRSKLIEWSSDEWSWQREGFELALHKNTTE